MQEVDKQMTANTVQPLTVIFSAPYMLPFLDCFMPVFEHLDIQLIVAEESGITNVVDPLGGSYYVESLTDQLEAHAEELIDTITEMGGAVAAIEEGWMQSQIEDSAYKEAQRQGSGESVLVGVNRFEVDDNEPVPVLEVHPALEASQKEAVAAWRAIRDQEAADSALADVVDAAASDVNLMAPIKDALAAGATVGEVSDALRGVFGLHRPLG